MKLERKSKVDRNFFGIVLLWGGVFSEKRNIKELIWSTVRLAKYWIGIVDVENFPI